VLAHALVELGIVWGVAVCVVLVSGLVTGVALSRRASQAHRPRRRHRSPGTRRLLPGGNLYCRLHRRPLAVAVPHRSRRLR